MNIRRMGFFEHDRRRCIDTRLAAAGAGLTSIVYGTKATQPGYSEFQTILKLQEYAFEWGVLLAAIGVLMIIFSPSRYHWWRLAFSLLLMVAWAGVAAVFLIQRDGGIPLWIGLIQMGICVADMITILTHEKHIREAERCAA
jgi:hypothetical protein